MRVGRLTRAAAIAAIFCAACTAAVQVDTPTEPPSDSSDAEQATRGTTEDVAEIAEVDTFPAPTAAVEDGSPTDIMSDPPMAEPAGLISEPEIAVLGRGEFWSSRSMVTDQDGFAVISFVAGTELTIVRCGDLECSPGHRQSSTPVARPAARSYLTIDDQGLPVVAFIDAERGKLHLLRCDDALCLGEGDSVHEPMSDVRPTSDVSLHLDGAGNPVMAFAVYDFDTDGNLPVDAIRLVRCDDAACDPTGNSTSLIVEPGITAFNIMMSGEDGFPHFLYTDRQLDLISIRCTDLECGEPYELATVPGVKFSNWFPLDIALTRTGQTVISFENPEGDLALATCSDQTCSSTTIRTVYRRDEQSRLGFSQSLALADGQLPVISHRDFDQGLLLMTRCHDRACLTVETTAVLSSDIVDDSTIGDTSLVVSGPELVLAFMTYGSNQGDRLGTFVRLVRCNPSSCSVTDDG